jgi:hypothetical protein
MARRQVRDRFPEELGVAVRCSRCNKRLGFASEGAAMRRDMLISGMWLSDAVDYTGGTYFEQRAPLPRIKMVSEEDWLRLRCRRCGFDWQGRQERILDAVRNAAARHAPSIPLP